MSAMSEPKAKAGSKRSASWWIPWLFVGFFGVVVMVNGIMLFFALDSWTGIETEEAYRKGLAYNEQIAAAEAQQQLGWSAELAVEQPAPGRAAIALELRDRAGGPVEGAEVTGQLLRPTLEGYDLTAPLTHSGPGTYSAELTLPLAGIWDLEIEVRHARGTYRLTERLTLK